MTARTRTAPYRLAPAAPRFVVVPARRRAPRVRSWGAVAAVVIAAFLGFTWSRTALDKSAFELQEIQLRIQREEARYWDLRLEAARLQDPARITRLAEEMGMVYPDEVRTIEVRGVSGPGNDAEERWADLKGLLGAQP